MASQKAVVIIHGVNDTPATLEFFANYLKECLPPETKVYLIHILHGWLSIIPMWNQIERFRVELEKILAENPQGIHLIGYSQGGLIARGLLETMPNHMVDTFISLSAPQLGQYGETMLKKQFYYRICLALFNRLAYTKLGQIFSICNYWKNPYSLNDYLKCCTFLPQLNNEIVHSRSEEFKSNFLKIKRLILIGGPQDTTITPWQSSHFSFFEPGTEAEIFEIKEEAVYTQDTFGLQTLDKRGDLTIFSVPGIDHVYWPNNTEFIKEYIVPYLK